MVGAAGGCGTGFSGANLAASIGEPRQGGPAGYFFFLCELIAKHFARLAANKIDQQLAGRQFGPVRFLVAASPIIAQYTTE